MTGTISMPRKVREKLDVFLRDVELQTRFAEILEKVSLEDVIWPDRNPKAFGREFRASYRTFACPYPLWEHEHRIRYIELKIESLSRHSEEEGIHPSLAFFYLYLYRQNFEPEPGATARKTAAKKVTKKAAKKTGKKASRKVAKKVAPKLSAAALAREREEELRDRLYKRIDKLKSKLAVPLKFKRAKSAEELRELLLEELQGITDNYRRQSETVRTLTAEVEGYRNPDYMHPEIRQTMEEIVSENTELKLRLNRETRRADSLEQEVSRLAEQIISRPRVSDEVYSEETDELQREYTILSEKYDGLVNQNIELSNRLEKLKKAKALESILDLIRDKINGVLRAGVTQNDDVLLKSIQEEVSQIKRARLYLGRALYDVGMLYLRLGQKSEALTEFRAARELGIEDAETNKLLNNSSENG